jgi:hypothetical protein
VINQVDTVSSSTGVNLANTKSTRATPFLFQVVINNGANTLTVYAFNPASGTADTINGTAGATGVSMVAASYSIFMSAKPGVWFQVASGGAATFGALTVTTINGQTPVGLNNAQTLTNKTLVDVINQDTVYGTALAIVSTTTLANVPGLAVALTTSGTYSIIAELPITASVAGPGLAVAAVSSGGVLTATSFNLTGKFTGAGATAAINTTTLSGAVGTTTAMVLAELAGTIVVNTGGTLVIQAAQQSSSTATTTVVAGGFLQVTRIS